MLNLVRMHYLRGEATAARKVLSVLSIAYLDYWTYILRSKASVGSGHRCSDEW